MQFFWHGCGAVCLYLLIAASTMLLLRRLIAIPDELFRKALHFVLLGSYIPFVFSFALWWHSVIFAIVLELLIYPALAWAEHFPAFSAFVTEDGWETAIWCLPACMHGAWAMPSPRYAAKLLADIICPLPIHTKALRGQQRCFFPQRSLFSSSCYAAAG